MKITQYGLSVELRSILLAVLAVLMVVPAVRAEEGQTELETLAVEETIFLAATPVEQGMSIDGIEIVVDLRYPYEGVYDELGMLKQKGIRALNIPVSSRGPSAENLESLTIALQDAGTQNVLIHDSNGHRTAMLWAIYRLNQGVTIELAVEEVKTLYDAPELRSELERISQRLAVVDLDG